MSTRAATRPKAAPTGTKNVVKQGQSSRMAHGRNAQAKAAANKAKVVAINEGILIGKAKAERLAAARKEEKALNDWKKAPASKRGPRPATPNRDAIINASSVTKERKMSTGTKVRTPRKLEGDALANAKKAYELRVHKQQGFQAIADALGYPKARIARKACVMYAKQHHMADPIARRSAKSAQSFAEAQGEKFDPKAFKPTVAKRATAAKKAPAAKAPAKPTGAVKKQTPGQKARTAKATASARAKAGVKPIPKKAPAKKAMKKSA